MDRRTPTVSVYATQLTTVESLEKWAVDTYLWILISLLKIGLCLQSVVNGQQSWTRRLISLLAAMYIWAWWMVTMSYDIQRFTGGGDQRVLQILNFRQIVKAV